MAKEAHPRIKWWLVGLCLIGLSVVYVFQRTDYYLIFFGFYEKQVSAFIFNKTFRLVINDLLCLLLIYALFHDKKYLKLASVILLIELFVIMPIYFWIKLKVEGSSEISSPLLSQIHRLIVNPLLMGILIIGLYYQKYWANRNEI
ncbi:MAG: exosortase F system-associated protein [Bacteroidetes bacterium]|nr:exosortase F system-associated protein [Bacteroidota bacterium]